MVQSHMSRPSCDRPMLDSCINPGYSAAKASRISVSSGNFTKRSNGTSRICGSSRTASGGRLPSRNYSGSMSTLVLLRHGQSVWNEQDLFTGWYDAELTAKGEAEAREAGRLLVDEGIV